LLGCSEVVVYVRAVRVTALRGASLKRAINGEKFDLDYLRTRNIYVLELDQTLLGPDSATGESGHGS
jgi:hypothetical protein